MPMLSSPVPKILSGDSDKMCEVKNVLVNKSKTTRNTLTINNDFWVFSNLAIKFVLSNNYYLFTMISTIFVCAKSKTKLFLKLTK
jgi:hypothetical protein